MPGFPLPAVVDPMSSASDDDSDSSSDDWLPRPVSPGPLGYHYCPNCKLCQQLEASEVVAAEEGDEEKYLFPRERDETEFVRDKALKLRFISYRKSLVSTGGFDVECPPICICSGGAISPLAHYVGSVDHLERKAKKSVEFVIEAYNETKKRKELELLEILNSTGCFDLTRFVYYLTFKCSINPLRPQGTESRSSSIYQAVVSCEYLPDPDEDDDKKIMIFRNSNGKDLLDPDKSEARFIEAWKNTGKDLISPGV